MTLGIIALFDLTGIAVYRMMRRRLAVEKVDESAAEPFRSSADLLFRTRREVVEASRGATR
jgi:hypothetical protein